jgi:phosphomannomutase
MKFEKPVAKTKLEEYFLSKIEADTPNDIKKYPLINLNNKKAFKFTLTKEHLLDFDIGNNGLGIWKWFENYKKEATVSTAGIRGLQNPLYPWDTRYPMNLLSVALATLGKIVVSKETSLVKSKISACESRYNSKEYVELISRIQAAYGLKTYITFNYDTMPIFLISYLIFMFDLYGGEYVTSSHALAKKIATKDLNTQGSQYIPEESLKFVDKVEEILKEVENKGKYEIRFSSATDKKIDAQFLKKYQ